MEIQNFKTNKNDNVVASFDLYIANWGLYLRSLRLIRKKDGGEFISFPARKYEDGEETKYYKYYYFESSKNEAFQKAVKELLTPFLKEDQPEYKQEELPF